MKPQYNKIVGIYPTKSTGRYKAEINNKNIGTFDKRSDAIDARLIVEDIFKNVLEKLDIESFNFNREESISVEVLTTTGELLSINTGILYSNYRKKSREVNYANNRL